jgi:type IV pilus assembly protein PilC
MKATAQISILKRVSSQEKLLFTKHMDTMIKAGIPIVEALETLEDQTQSPYFKEVIGGIVSDVKNGKSLAKSLSKYPKVFDEFYVSLIKVGEASGTLDENLTFLVTQMGKDIRLRKQIRNAMFYPALVLTATVIMGGFISFFVLPKLVDFFASFDIELPLTTRILLFVALTMRDYGIFIITGVVVFLVLARLITRMPAVRPTWHSFLLKIPLIGKLIAYGQLARFSRNLGTLIQSGVPINEGLEITSDTLSNLRFKNDLLQINSLLEKGKNIGDTMKKGKFSEYPPLVSRMIAIGEKTGKLDETLLYLSNFYDDEIDDISKNLSTIIEPVLLIIIGVLVGFVALSIISPIYELTGSIRR